MRSRHEVGDPCPLLSELELEAIRRGLRAGARGPIVVSWVERLLADHDERVRRDRALAVRLLSDVARAGATTSTDRSIEGY